MHYKNSREAKAGDPVVGIFEYNSQVYTGVIHSFNPGLTTCNCTVAVVVPGGVNQVACVNVSDLYHAEDAYSAVQNSTLGPPKESIAPKG
jgi:hypothetical protein